MLRLKWHFCIENKEIRRDMFKTKSKFNPLNKDAAIEPYLRSLEEKLMKVGVSKDKFSKLSNSEQEALYDLKNDKSIVLKVLIRVRRSQCGIEKTIKEAEKQVGGEEVNKEFSTDAGTLLKTVNAVIAKVRKRGDLKRDNINCFVMKGPSFARFYLLPEIHKNYIISQVDQEYLIVVTILKIYPHFWTIIYNYQLKQ